jgi:hypothetical protein
MIANSQLKTYSEISTDLSCWDRNNFQTGSNIVVHLKSLLGWAINATIAKL